jgi:C2 domain in Dock180 and Zizimin proteins
VTNGGTAMLVMRNFGYLGLHHVVNNKSSLARHRLVDFSGELQVRRRTTEDPNDKREKRRDSDNYRVKLPPWHPSYVAEPVENGGRIDDSVKAYDVDCTALDASQLYAQELAPLPLMLAPVSTFSTGPQAGMAPARSTYEDIEPFYQTIFSNEMICHPRILHNCKPGHYSVKIELREIEWNESLKAYLAHLPRPGINPCIHNPRRGPFLVKSALTSCTAETGEHHFIDEFKIKLPLDLTSKDPDGENVMLSLFFTVYRIKSHNKSKWKRGAKMLFGTSLLDSLRNGDENNITGRVKPVACGFLPIAPQSYLLDDGIHDVRVAYIAQSPPAEFCSMPNHKNSLMLVEREINKSSLGNLFSRESAVDESVVDNTAFDNRLHDVESSVQTDDSSTDFQSTDDAFIRGEKNAGASDMEHVSLSVSPCHASNTVVENSV